MKMFVTTYDDMLKKVTELTLPETELILELGCSDGKLASLLYDNGVRHNYIGIDCIDWVIEYAKKNNPKMNFMCSTISDKMFMIKDANKIIALQIFEHLDNDEDIKVISEMKKGTSIIFSVPNFDAENHKRWFEFNGWKERYKDYLTYKYEAVFHKPTIKRLPNLHKTFLFKGIRK